MLYYIVPYSLSEVFEFEFEYSMCMVSLYLCCDVHTRVC